MDEDLARTLLTRIADAPEPAARIDIERARRDGRRRLLTARIVIPAATLGAAALALGVIVAVPHALSPSPERSRPPAAPSQPAEGVTAAPAQFNPLVPYAAFGWLPSGFSESAVSGLWTNPFQSARTSLTLGAENAGLRTLLLTVNSRGACQVTAATPVNSTTPCVIDTGAAGTSKAPDINGRPAWYLGYGTTIAWEYAPNAWATLATGVDETTPVWASAQWIQQQAIARRAAAPGWTLTKAKTQAKGKDGQLIAPSAQAKALLDRVASTVKYGETEPVVFPFRLTGGLPAGWQLTSVTFRPYVDQLIGSGLSVGPAADPSALSVGASRPSGYGCNYVTGQSSYVTRYGVSWIDRVIGEVNKDDEILCSTGKAPTGLVDDEGLQVFIYLEANDPGSGSLLPGVSSLGGAFGVYSRMKFLGVITSAWTPDPLG